MVDRFRVCIVLRILFIAIAETKELKHNIILIITDDQDKELGSLDAMPRTVRLLGGRGVSLHGYATTPICCPSRSSIMTGLYAHNHNVHTNNNNCSGPEWRSIHEKNTFGVYAQKQGYRTLYTGKYLNEYDGSYIPPGWDEWSGLVHNSRYYNYTLNENGEKKKYGFDYDKDYLTDVVTNKTLDFISRVAIRKGQPFLAVLSYPAPHGPEDPAPQHAHSFADAETHRTAAWNYAPNPDKQWLLQRTGKMEAVHVFFTDLLHRRRLQTLQSVDEGIEKIVHQLRDRSVLSSTYIIFTSDHGYHLGQFGLIKGKNMPYEFDVRVPFFIRGPGIERNTTIRRPVANIDIAPTILDMAGVAAPPHMDGRSILQLIHQHQGSSISSEAAPWRETLLIERGKMPKMRSISLRLERQKARFGRKERVAAECRKKKWQQPCGPNQIYNCVREAGEWRVSECPTRNRSCSCRNKRSTDEESSDHIIDDFLQYIHATRIRETHEWFQGIFELPDKSSRQRRDVCECPEDSSNSSISTDLLPSSNLYQWEDDELGTVPLSKRHCSLPQMSCFSHTASHWKTPPFWPAEYGHFCFCQNSNNNTYWCLRTLNETHNTLYCEFVTEFVSFYDLNIDPYQLTNAVFSLARDTLELLSSQLARLRGCKGHQC